MKKQKTRWITFGCILALLAVMDVGGFCLGKSTEADKYQAETDKYQAEADK